MAIHDSRLAFDGDQTWVLGQDTGRKPLDLPAGRYSLGRNVAARGGTLGTRPGIDHLPLTFADSEQRNLFAKGKYQGMAIYEDDLLTMIHGRLFRIDLESYEVEELTDLVGANNRRMPMAIFQQAGPFMVIQNGVDRAIIGHGSTWRRAGVVPNPSYDSSTDPIWRSTALEVPTGLIMGYGYDRLYVAKGNRWTAGDILKVGSPEDVLRWSENLYLNEGGSFVLPSWMGNITAMAFARVTDTSLGIGAFIVFGQWGAMAYDVSLARDEWAGQVVHVGPGAVGPRAVANVNADLWFRAADGIRSWRMAVAQQTDFVNTPESSEMSRELELDTPWQMDGAAVVNFDNRLLTACWPQYLGVVADNVPWFKQLSYRGIISLDFDPSSTILEKNNPAYDGVWDGIFPMDMVTGPVHGEQRCFAMSCDDVNFTRLYEISRRRPNDSFNGTEIPIRSYVETRGYNFQQPFNQTQLQTGDIWIRDVAGDVHVRIAYRTDTDPTWVAWFEKELQQTIGSGRVDSLQLPTYRPGLRARIRLGQAPTEDCEVNDLGYLYQIAIQWIGRASIDRVRLAATILDETTHGGGCEETEPQAVLLEAGVLDPYTIAPDAEDALDAGTY